VAENDENDVSFIRIFPQIILPRFLRQTHAVWFFDLAIFAE